MVGECDNMVGGYDVVYTDKGGAVSIWYYREWVGSDMGCFFDGFRFHVALADGCSWWGWADVRFPCGGSHEEATGGGCQHCAAVKDCIGIVWGCVDILNDCLDTGVTSPWGWRVVVVRRVVAVWCGWRWSASPREIWWALLVGELLVWAWSILWVIEPLVLVGCCFAE